MELTFIGTDTNIEHYITASLRFFLLFSFSVIMHGGTEKKKKEKEEA